MISVQREHSTFSFDMSPMEMNSEWEAKKILGNVTRRIASRATTNAVIVLPLKAYILRPV